MMMTVKRNYLIQLKNILEHPEAIFDGQVSGQIRYMVSMNYKTAKEEFDAVLEAFPFDPSYLKYIEARRAYLAEAGIVNDADFAAKDEDTKKTIQERLNALAEEYKDGIAAETAMAAERDQFLDQNKEVNLYTISPDKINLKENAGWDIWNILFNDGNGIVRE